MERHLSSTPQPTRSARTRGGFTLLELIVVLTIMGFLIAMVAPKLANVASSAIDTACDTNQNRLRTFVNIATTQENKLPTRLTNLIIVDSNDGLATGFTAGSEIDDTLIFGDADDGFRVVSDGDPVNGQDFLAAEFAERSNFFVHILNADEADELYDLGVTKVLTYGKADAVAGSETEIAEMYVLTDVAEGTPVLMFGMGAADATAELAAPPEVVFGHPELIGRIVLGISPDASLVTGGMIENAPSCPGGLVDDANTQYNWYNLAVPRLEATVARYDTTTPFTTITATGEGTGQVKTIDLTEVQEIWQTTSTCPEGHQWPVAETEEWTIEID